MLLKFLFYITLFVLLLKTESKKTDTNQDFSFDTDQTNVNTSLVAVSSGSGENVDEESASGHGTDDEDNADNGSGGTTYEHKPTTTLRQLTPCQKMRDGTPPLHSSYIPECTDTGLFKKLQCQGEEKCWCAGPEGGIIIGTTKFGEMKNPRERPDCEGGSNLTPCVTLLVKSSWSGLLGAKKPSCTLGGQFKPRQCHENECWCVDEFGKIIEGSAKMLPQLPNCDYIVNHGLKKMTRPAVAVKPTSESDIKVIDDTYKGKGSGNPYEEDNIDIDNLPDDDDDEDDEEDDDEYYSENDTRYDKSRQDPDRKTKPLLIQQPGIMAGIIGGALVGFLCIVLLIMFLVYRLRKKDSGSYALDEPTKPRGAYAYQKAPDKELYA